MTPLVLLNMTSEGSDQSQEQGDKNKMDEPLPFSSWSLWCCGTWPLSACWPLTWPPVAPGDGPAYCCLKPSAWHALVSASPAALSSSPTKQRGETSQVPDWKNTFSLHFNLKKKKLFSEIQFLKINTKHGHIFGVDPFSSDRQVIHKQTDQNATVV